jgi:hypothetical protein
VQQVRQGNEARKLQAARPLDDGALVQLGIDAGERRQVDDRAEADALPDARAHVDRAKPARLGEVTDLLASQCGHQAIDHAVVGQYLLEHSHDDDDGDEIGQKADRLDGPLVAAGTHLVEQ